MTRFLTWRPSRRWLALPPVMIGIITIVLFANSRRELVRVEVEEQAVAVPIQLAELAQVGPVAVGYGSAEPLRTWNCIAEVGGKVESIHPDLESGNRVSEGSVLVQIEARDYRLRVEQREADLDAAEAKVDELLASQDADRASLVIEEKLWTVAEADEERLRSLRSSKSASQAEYDQARSNLLRQAQSVQKLKNSLSLMPSRIAAARASVAMAKGMLEEVKHDLERTTIVAPFEGRLAGVTIEPGQVVSPATPLFDLLDVATIEIEAEYAPAQLLPLHQALSRDGTHEQGSDIPDATVSTMVGQPSLMAVVSLRSGQSELFWPARPVRLSERVDPSTRTLGVVVQVDNRVGRLRPAAPRSTGSLTSSTLQTGRPESSNGWSPIDRMAEFDSVTKVNGPAGGMRLHPGAYCEVRLWVDVTQPLIVVPASAVDQSTVFVVTAEKRLQQRQVEVAYPVSGGFAIRAGLSEGDRVVVEPPVPSIDGMLVNPYFADALSPEVASPLTAGEP